MIKIKNIKDLIETFKNEKRIALIYNGKKISYESLYNDIISFSYEISTKSKKKGFNIAVVLKDDYQVIISLFAIIYSGSVPLLISEKDFFLNDKYLKKIYKINKIVVNENFKNKNFLKKDTIRFSTKTNINWKNFEYVKKIKLKKGDTALILLTSGTTGFKKGVILSHNNLLFTSLNLNKFMNLNKNVCEYLMVPLTNSFGFARMRSIFLKKGCLIIDNGFFNPLLMLQRLREHNINSISGVPSSFAMLLTLPTHSLNQLRKSLIWMEIGSASMEKYFKLKLLKLFNKQIIAYHYGLTEASRSSLINLRNDFKKITTVGKAPKGVEINICDENRKIIKKKNFIGEIIVKGKNIAKGYVNGNFKNFKSGRFFTGDLGSIDQDGYLTIHGRIDDLINIGGVKISANLIEKIIHKNISMRCEFAIQNSHIKDDILGNRIALYIDKNIKINTLLKKINNIIIKNGIPSEGKIKDVFYVKKFPKTLNGKLKRKEIYKNISNTIFSTNDYL